MIVDMKRFSLLVFLALSACANANLPDWLQAKEESPPIETETPPESPAENVETVSVEDVEEVVMTPPPPPPETATTAEEFDTTSEEQKAAALAEPEPEAESNEVVLGTTLATLGDPSDPGIWLKTPLVKKDAPGRVTYEGREINIALRPSGGEPGSGSQISLAAMQLLEAPLTGIIELTVTKL